MDPIRQMLDHCGASSTTLVYGTQTTHDEQKCLKSILELLTLELVFTDAVSSLVE